MKNFKKLLSALLVCCGLAILNPVQANAAWKQNNTGWWYTQGNSYSIGWQQIDGKWYYFDSTGYMKTGWINDNGTWYYCWSNGEMAQDCYVGNYYLNSNGQWTNESSNISKEEAQERVKAYLLSNDKYVPTYVEYDHEEGNSYVIHCYEIVNSGGFVHTATSGWYYVNKTSGNISSMF